MNRGAWQATDPGVAESQTQLSIHSHTEEETEAQVSPGTYSHESWHQSPGQTPEHAAGRHCPGRSLLLTIEKALSPPLRHELLVKTLPYTKQKLARTSS